MASSPQTLIATTIGGSPPVPNVRLVAWGLVAQWETPTGEKLLTRMASVNTSLWEFKGYLHEALYGSWVTDTDGWGGSGNDV